MPGFDDGLFDEEIFDQIPPQGEAAVPAAPIPSVTLTLDRLPDCSLTIRTT